MLRLSRIIFTASALALLAVSPAYSAEARDTGGNLDRISSLEPGQFVWNEERTGDGKVEIVVSLPQQLAYVYRDGRLIGVSTVSSGQPGYDTPTGTFAILQKNRDHRSNLYDGAPMPFMQRLTWDGIALHAGEIPGRPASHGCVRLPQRFARDLFALTELGATVHITDATPDSPGTALAMARAEAQYTGMGGPDPELDPGD